MIGLSWLLAFAAAADCPERGPLLARAESDAVSYYLADAKASLQQAMGAFACGPRASEKDVARYLRIHGLLAYLDEDEAAATRAFAAAKALGSEFPGDYGPQLEVLWSEAAVEAGDELELTLRARPDDSWVAIDGTDLSEPLTLAPGPHVLQVGGGDVAWFARFIDASEPVTVEVVRMSRAVPTVGEPPVAPEPVVETEPEPEEESEGTDEPEEPTDADVEAVSGYRPPFLQVPGGYKDARERAMTWRGDLVPLASRSVQGQRSLQRFRSNPVGQGVAIGTALAAGYGSYVYAWDASVGHNLDSDTSVGAATLLGALSATALVWEVHLLRRRSVHRRAVMEAAEMTARGN